MKGLNGREQQAGEVSSVGPNSESESPVEYCIDAEDGNVARFINHSCAPNLFVQCVLSSHHDIKFAKVMLFAADTIPPLQELTYDYGYAMDSTCGGARWQGHKVGLLLWCSRVPQEATLISHCTI